MELAQYLFGAICAGVWGFHEWKHQKCKEDAQSLHKTITDEKSEIN